MTSITHRAVMHLHTPDYLWVHAGAQRACRIQPAESDTLTPSAVTVTCELISSLRTQRTFRTSANVNKRPYRWLIVARSAARLRGAYTFALRCACWSRRSQQEKSKIKSLCVFYAFVCRRRLWDKCPLAIIMLNKHMIYDGVFDSLRPIWRCFYI